ncbi:MAG: YHS domain-containing protein [Gemmatimonadota bacterium]
MKYRDPVCGKRINRNKAHIVVEYRGAEYYVCCSECQSAFERDPEHYARHESRRRRRARSGGA